MKLKFTKMHGAGNDFVVLDATRAPLSLSSDQMRLLADRRFGVGADQILIVEGPPADAAELVDFTFRIFNSDGAEVEQCGNGARAFARYVHDRGLTSKTSLRVATAAGVIAPHLETDGSVTVDMGVPHLKAEALGFEHRGITPSPLGRWHTWPVSTARGTSDVVLVSMGNPHAVLLVEDVDTAPVSSLGSLIEHQPRFTRRVNVGFLQIIASHEARLRVWERGAGETLACGSGACAAVVAGILVGRLDSPVRVEARGGLLTLTWAGEGKPVLMNGPAVAVFDGEIDLDVATASPRHAQQHQL